MGKGSEPGFSTIQETEEVQVWYAGIDGQNLVAQKKATILSTETDAGNTNLTETLRGGLVMAVLDSGGKAVLYDPDANDGSQCAVGILPRHLDMNDDLGTVEDKFSFLIINGLIQESAVLNLDDQAKATLVRQGMRFDDWPDGAAYLVHPKCVSLHITDYTIVAADNGKLFVASAADCDFTLPTIAVGLSFEFIQTADFELKVTGAATTVMTFNNAAATSVAFTTASEQIGAHLRVSAINIGPTTLKWMVEILSTGTLTVA